MLHIATPDEHAFAEVRDHLRDFVEVERLDFGYVRIRSDDIEDVAAIGAADAYDNAPRPGDDGDGDDRPPVVVDESGLFVEGLGGFPGPYTTYVEETLGADRLHELAEPLEDRRAIYRTAVAFADDERVVTFQGAREGELVAPRGAEGAGVDRLFEVRGETFAEMSMERKNSASSRGRALTKLADWLAP
ncbi:MAG: non-canonical purine NTP pyrophosphatase [Haloferacaceae archaeon]